MDQQDKFGIIYKATAPNGKCYIGQTVKNLDKRIAIHKNASRQKRYENNKFYNALRKYIDAIVWEILEADVPISLLDEKETAYISQFDSFNNGYNSSPGGSVRRGFKVSEETRARMSAAAKLRGPTSFGPRSELGKANMSKASKGKPKSLKHRESLSKATKRYYESKKSMKEA